MPIKMIVTDLDGTLLRDDKTISERTLAVLKRCRARGIKVAYATGRGSTDLALAPPELFDGRVRCNGAEAYIGKTLVYDRLIPISNMFPLLIAADGAGVEIAAEVEGVHYANFNVTAKWPWIPHYRNVNEVTDDFKAQKIYAVAERSEVAELIKKRLPPGFYLSVSRDGLAMVMHDGAIKSRAVTALAESWGIDPAEIVAFGDDANDVDLLQFAGTGVAMGNAIDDVKAAADCVCDTNESDGVAKWIEENVL